MHPDEPSQYRIPPYGYGQPPAVPPYGTPPQYGPPPWNANWNAAPWNAPWAVPQVPLAWPHGPGRPGTATAAAVLGFVTGGLTALAGLGFLLAVLLGDADLPTGLLALGLPCAAGLIRGGVLVLRRDGAGVLIGSCIAAVGVLLVGLLAGALSYGSDDLVGMALFDAMAAVLPVVTASLAASGTVRGWLSALD